MSVIDRVKDHFENQGVKKIEVAEWGEEGKPLIIYSTPMSMAEKRNLFKSAKDGDLGVMVDAIVLKSKDSEGNKIFKRNGLYYLLHIEFLDKGLGRGTYILRSKNLYGTKPDGTPGGPGDPGGIDDQYREFVLPEC